jgi:hypothetical protein
MPYVQSIASADKTATAAHEEVDWHAMAPKPYTLNPKP